MVEVVESSCVATQCHAWLLFLKLRAPVARTAVQLTGVMLVAQAGGGVFPAGGWGAQGAMWGFGGGELG
jgi:hypothetical protein